MRSIRAVALSVFKESVRDRVFYNLVLFAVLLIGASYLISQLTAGQDIKIIKDLGLAATSIFGLLIAVFIGIGLVSKEVERRSIYNVLSKPVRRQEFLIGKFAGLLLTVLVNVAVMTAALYAVLAVLVRTNPAAVKAAVEAPVLDPALLKALVLIYAELAVVTACALFISSFSTPILSAVFTLGIYVAGQFAPDLKKFDTVVDSPAAAWFARGLYYVLPNLAPFDVKAAVVHGRAVPAGYIWLTLGYAAVYMAVFVVGAVAIFARRDFK
jgi:ABC-type transport system involved in multi-copper enzyme maturation permease subunit